MKTRSFPKLGLLIIALAAVLTSCAAAQLDMEPLVASAVNLASKQVSQGLCEEALSTYDQALEKVSDWRLSFNRAIVLATMERTDEAVKAFDEGFSLYPNRICFLTAKAEFLDAIQSPLAKEAWDKVYELNPYYGRT